MEAYVGGVGVYFVRGCFASYNHAVRSAYGILLRYGGLYNERDIKKEIHSYKEFAFLGVAGGAAVLSKISAGIVLLPFLVGFIIVYILKNKKVKSVFLMLSAGVAAVFIPLGYWVRTAIDLNGDFLALKTSAVMSVIPLGG